jgi:hypothetical protein
VVVDTRHRCWSNTDGRTLGHSDRDGGQLAGVKSLRGRCRRSCNEGSGPKDSKGAHLELSYNEEGRKSERLVRKGRKCAAADADDLF